MIVKKFQGVNQKEAEEKARKALGPDVIILMSKQVKKKGLLSTKTLIEVTAATEEKGESVTAPQEEVVYREPKKKSVHQEDSFQFSPQAMRQLNNKAPIASTSRRVIEKEDEQDQAIEALRKRRAGKLEVVDESETTTVAPIQDIKAYVRNEILEAQKSVPKTSIRSAHSPFLPFLLRRGVSEELSRQVDHKLMDVFGALNLAQPSIERTECFKMLKREIINRLKVHGPICLDPYRTTYTCFVGPEGAGKFSSAAKLAMQYQNALDKRVGIICLGERLSEKNSPVTELLKSQGVDLIEAHSLRHLSQCVGDFDDKDFVIICYEKAFSERYVDQTVMQGLKHLLNGVTFHFVVKAKTKPNVLENSLEEYRSLDLDSLIVTNLDQGVQLGTLVSFCHSSNLPISYLSTGSRIPEDLKIADQQEIAKKILLEETYQNKQSVYSQSA